MMKLTPAVRLSLGLVFLTLSILVVAQSLGLSPDLEREQLHAREQMAENLALQTTLAVKRNDPSLLRNLFDTTVERNASLESMALRKNSGAVVYATGDHELNWRLLPGERSTPTQMRIPILSGQEQKGALEVAFKPLRAETSNVLGIPHFVLFMGFVCAAGFVAFWVYIKRVLHQLDPSSVVPARVRNALNIMAEGVMILDKREQIVLANEAICQLLQQPEAKLVGRKAADLGWELEASKASAGLPWQVAQKSGLTQVNARLSLPNGEDKTFMFRVNAVPIKDGKGSAQGVIVSFDNITELEEKNQLLKQMVQNLADKQQAIELKNKELHHLASRDPLTNCFNRRTLFEHLTEVFARPDVNKRELCVIMTDIDKFKSINDTYGHNFGDETIQSIASTLKTQAREQDLVARFGGEEFCIVLPDTTIEEACSVAEACRAAIEAKPINNVKITSSFGVASVRFGAKTPNELINLADQALYKSKEDGRNRSTMWSPFMNREKKAAN